MNTRSNPGIPTGEPPAEYEAAHRAGRHWPATPPTAPDTEPYQFGSQTLTRCPKCAGEYDTSVVPTDNFGNRRCPLCAQTHHRGEIPSPVTATESLARGRRAAGTYTNNR
ncbi:hypothetical protein M3F59_12750 [Brachybacterium muris]|uniref:hypothetical protein n=1 Tax=Brachybacterium muris TaxID=219301 RepID=UPI00223B53A6|nr:hypothetical protein [Brachybacterium muris]MCT2262472.1 hypothetical protein [Brachybacterium muris]